MVLLKKTGFINAHQIQRGYIKEEIKSFKTDNITHKARTRVVHRRVFKCILGKSAIENKIN